MRTSTGLTVCLGVLLANILSTNVFAADNKDNIISSTSSSSSSSASSLSSASSSSLSGSSSSSSASFTLPQITVNLPNEIYIVLFINYLILPSEINQALNSPMQPTFNSIIKLSEEESRRLVEVVRMIAAERNLIASKANEGDETTRKIYVEHTLSSEELATQMDGRLKLAKIFKKLTELMNNSLMSQEVYKMFLDMATELLRRFDKLKENQGIFREEEFYEYRETFEEFVFFKKMALRMVPRDNS